MASITSSPAIQRVLWTLVLIAGAVALTLFFSYVRPLLDALLGDVRTRMRNIRDGIVAAAERVVGDRFRAFFELRAHEPHAPVVAELGRLATAVETVGNRQVTALRDFEERLGRHVGALKSLNAPESQSIEDRQRIVDSVSGTSILGLLTLILMSIVMGLVNASLLGIFFVEVIGPESIFKYPLPNIPRGYVLAALMFVVEVASGWAIYRSGVRAQRPEGSRGAGAAFFRAAPWVLLLALAIVEIAAYSLLSQRVDLPHRLNLDPNGPMYGLAQYFLAFLGLGLTLLLAYLGHAIAEGLDERRRSTVARDLVRAIRRGKDTAVQQAERLRDLLGRCVQTSTNLPASVPEEFQRGLGTEPEKESVLAATRRTAVIALANADPSAAAALGAGRPLRIRTASQVWADLLVNALFLGIIGAVFVLTSYEILSYLSSGPEPSSPIIAWTAALAVPSAIVGMAVGAWNVLRGLRYASPVTDALPELRGRVILGWVLVGALAVAVLTLAALLAAWAGPYRSSVLYALLGALQGIALCVFAGWLDRGLLALVHLGYLSGLGLVRLGALVIAALAALVGAICYVAIVLVRLLAIPGDVFRGRQAAAIQPIS